MGWFGSAVSAIGGALSSVGSAICSGISSLCSGIGGSFFSGIGTLATSLILPGLGLPELLLGIQIISAIVSAIAEILGIKQEEETPEELGMKAEQAEKKPEDFDSTEAYIEYLRNEVSVDKEKLENLSEEEKVKYGAIGGAIYIKGIEEKYGIEAPAEFWTTVANFDMKGEEVKQYIDSCKANGITNMKDVSDYIKGVAPESGTKPEVVSNSIMDALKKNNPEATEEELIDKFNELTL